MQFLRTHGLQKLCDDYKIITKRHSAHNNLVLLKYSMIDSPMGERISQECRSLILDEDDNWKPVCVPYFKFFNVGEGHAAKIEWLTAKCLAKLDGSIQTLYFAYGKWHVSTSGVPDGYTRVHYAADVTFADLFWKIWKRKNYKMPTDQQHCYMFELVGPLNRIVVPYEESDLILHGVRNVASLQEVDPSPFAKEHNWSVVQEFPLQTLEDVVKAANELNPMQLEGFVVRDGNFNRVKVKSPQYVALHYLKSTISVKKMVELVVANEGSEFLVYFPELTKLYDHVKVQYDKLLSEIDKAFVQFNGIEVQKDFALAIQHLPYKSVLFTMRKDILLTSRSILCGMSLDRAVTLLSLDNVNLEEFLEPQQAT